MTFWLNMIELNQGRFLCLNKFQSLVKQFFRILSGNFSRKSVCSLKIPVFKTSGFCENSEFFNAWVTFPPGTFQWPDCVILILKKFFSATFLGRYLRSWCCDFWMQVTIDIGQRILSLKICFVSDLCFRVYSGVYTRWWMKNWKISSMESVLLGFHLVQKFAEIVTQNFVK